MIRFTLTPYTGNKSSYPAIAGSYDTIYDFFGGSLGGTIQTAIANPNAKYNVAEASRCQRALIKCLNCNRDAFHGVSLYANELIRDFFEEPSYADASKWLSDQYQNGDDFLLTDAALSVMRRFFFSSILRTTPGSGKINVWISVRKILGDTPWKKACTELFPDVDYKNLDTAQTKEFNASLGQVLFENGVLEQAMRRSVASWYKSVQPLLDQWHSVPRRKLNVVDDYKQFLNSQPAGKTLCYIDPPYFNSNTGRFIDEAGRTRYHKQTPSYENHDPRSEATWSMFADCVDFAQSVGADMVLCNYGSDRYTSTMQRLANSYDIVTITDKKECQCTGQKSKYTTVPIGEESVYFCQPKVNAMEIAA